MSILSKRTPVKNHAGDVVFNADSGEVARMIELGQATYSRDGRSLLLAAFCAGKEHPCRTHTSRGGLMAAIGRSQVYTIAKRGRPATTRFKGIDHTDLSTFMSAVLDNLTVRSVPLPIARMHYVIDGCHRVLAVYEPSFLSKGAPRPAAAGV